MFGKRTFQIAEKNNLKCPPFQLEWQVNRQNMDIIRSLQWFPDVFLFSCTLDHIRRADQTLVNIALFFLKQIVL